MKAAGTRKFFLRVISHPMATTDARNSDISPTATRPSDPPEPAETDPTVGEPDQNTTVDLGRIAWLGPWSYAPSSF